MDITKKTHKYPTTLVERQTNRTYPGEFYGYSGEDNKGQSHHLAPVRNAKGDVVLKDGKPVEQDKEVTIETYRFDSDGIDSQTGKRIPLQGKIEQYKQVEGGPWEWVHGPIAPIKSPAAHPHAASEHHAKVEDETKADSGTKPVTSHRKSSPTAKKQAETAPTSASASVPTEVPSGAQYTPEGPTDTEDVPDARPADMPRADVPVST